MNALSAQFPEAMMLVALLLSVVCWRVIQMILTALAVGFVLLVVVGMAGCGAFTLLVS
jgi:hypothetical protein